MGNSASRSWSRFTKFCSDGWQVLTGAISGVWTASITGWFIYAAKVAVSLSIILSITHFGLRNKNYRISILIFQLAVSTVGIGFGLLFLVFGGAIALIVTAAIVHEDDTQAIGQLTHLAVTAVTAVTTVSSIILSTLRPAKQKRPTTERPYHCGGYFPMCMPVK